MNEAVVRALEKIELAARRVAADDYHERPADTFEHFADEIAKILKEVRE